MGNDYSKVSRLTRIYFDNKFYYYPLKIFNVLGNIGLIQAVFCLVSYVKEKIFPQNKNTKTFEDWVVSRFGQRLFNIFFKSYSEKLWGISCKDLDADFAAQRIKKLSFFEAIKSAFKISDPKKHKTLIDEFSYPHSGSGELYERMATGVLQAGGHIYLSRPVKGLWTDGNNNTLGVELFDGDFIGFDHVISSVPINKLLLSIKESPIEIREAALKLKFRNTILVYLEVEGSGLFPDQWLYIHDSKLQTGRITNFRNWVPSLYGASTNTILALEYWCYDHDLKWKLGDAELIELAMKETIETGLIKNRKILQGEVVRVPRCYPVYEIGYKENLNLVESYLQKITGLQVIGRYGAFKYNNQDHSILMGLLAAENVLHETKHNLWHVNTDYEYQESSSSSLETKKFKKSGII